LNKWSQALLLRLYWLDIYGFMAESLEKRKNSNLPKMVDLVDSCMKRMDIHVTIPVFLKAETRFQYKVKTVNAR
jgi:hypothetical protein